MNEREYEYDVIVVGGGPAGLTAAISAAEAGRRVMVLERLQRPGRKLLATGGGRCNLTREETPKQIAASFGRRQRFVLPALWGLSPEMLCYWLADLGVETATDATGRVYPASNKAHHVLAALEQRAANLGVAVRCGVTVSEISIDADRVAGVMLSGGELISCGAVILAAGGKAMPELGSDGSGFCIAEQAGHSISPPVPALVALITRERFVVELAGVALSNSRVRLVVKGPAKAPRTGDVLFTHRGVSGPAMLDISGEVAQLLTEQDEVVLRLELVNGMGVDAWREKIAAWRLTDGARKPRKLLGAITRNRLADTVCQLAEIPTATPLAEVTAAKTTRLAQILGAMELTIVATEGFDSAMVTRGGVRLGEVNEQTLESRIVGGLFFAGEVLDIAGPCGGYNLTWAFASGKLAGESVAGE